MARADAALPRASQARLFADLPAPEEEGDRPYSSGFVALQVLGSDQDRSEDAGEQAIVCSTLRAGALASNPLWVSRDRESTSGLDAWRLFHERRSQTSQPEPSRPLISPDPAPDTLFSPARS
jgi:hypothetical protein